MVVAIIIWRSIADLSNTGKYIYSLLEQADVSSTKKLLSWRKSVQGKRFAWITGLGYQAIAGAGYYLYSMSRLITTIQFNTAKNCIIHRLCRHGFVQFALFTYPHGYPNPQMYNLDILRIVSQSIPNQPEHVQVFWGYALHPDRVGNFIKKPMLSCSREEIMTELHHHLNFPVHDILKDQSPSRVWCFVWQRPFYLVTPRTDQRWIRSILWIWRLLLNLWIFRMKLLRWIMPWEERRWLCIILWGWTRRQKVEVKFYFVFFWFVVDNV